MPKIGLDVERALHNRSGLGQFSRWYLKGLSEYYPEAELFGYAKKPTRNTNTELPIWNEGGIQFYNSIKSDSSKLDVFHALSNYLPHQLFKKGNPFKTVVTIHDVLFKDFPENFDWSARLLYDLRTKQTLKYTDVIVCISEYTKQRLEHHYGRYLKSEPLVIYQSIPEVDKVVQSSIREKTNGQKKILICVGTVESRKNQLAVIQGFDKSGLADDYELVVVGRLRGDYGKKVETAAAKIKGVKIAGQVSSEELKQHYSEAVGAVYLSLGEGFGLPVLEAIQLGLPILTSGGGAMEEAGGKCVIYANPFDIDSTAVGFQKLVSPFAKDTLFANRAAHLAQFEPRHLFERYWKEAYGF